MNVNLEYVSNNNRRIIEQYTKSNFYLKTELSVKEYPFAVVQPKTTKVRGGVYNGQNSIEESIIHRGSDSNVYSPYDESKVIYEDIEVVYIGMLFNVWGHCLTDNLKHLWFLDNSNYEKLKELQFVYVLLGENRFLPENFYVILDKLGVKREQLRRIKVPTKFKKVFLPDTCFINNTELNCRQYTSEYRDIIKKITDSINVDNNDIYKKVYFSRSRIKGIKDFGEKRIENVFSKLGYTIIFPETLSLMQQISILKGCISFAGTEGSIVHNCIFLPQGAQLIIIRKADYMNSYQLALNDMKNLELVYIDSNKSIMTPSDRKWAGPFFLYVSKYLSDFAKIKQPLFPVFSFFYYLIIGCILKFSKYLVRKFNLRIITRRINKF